MGSCTNVGKHASSKYNGLYLLYVLRTQAWGFFRGVSLMSLNC